MTLLPIPPVATVTHSRKPVDVRREARHADGLAQSRRRH